MSVRVQVCQSADNLNNKAKLSGIWSLPCYTALGFLSSAFAYSLCKLTLGSYLLECPIIRRKEITNVAYIISNLKYIYLYYASSKPHMYLIFNNGTEQVR